MNQFPYRNLYQAQKLLEDKFILEFSYNDKNKKNTRKVRRQTIELTIGRYSLFC